MGVSKREHTNVSLSFFDKNSMFFGVLKAKRMFFPLLKNFLSLEKFCGNP
jgi:hypothetical protein